jgi:uncharacterized protein YuzE
MAMNIRPSESGAVIHFSGASVDHVEEVEADILVAYYVDRKIVDITIRKRSGIARVDLVDTGRSVGDVQVTYDADIDALAIDVLSSAYFDSQEVLPGIVVDYDTEGLVRGFEFLDASQIFSDQTMADIRKCATLLR